MMNNPVPAPYSDGDENLAATPQGDFSLVIHDTSDEQYCLDMFRRALLKSDQHAREQLQQRFSGLGLSWIRLHPRREEACRYQKEEYYVAQAFKCLWQATAHYKELKFSTLAAVLKYLQVSLNAVIIDTLRTYTRSREFAIEVHGCPEESVTAVHDNSNEVWNNMLTLLSDTREQRLAYLLFHCGLKPEEIAHFYPQDFSDVREISSLRHNIIEQVLLYQG
jgi:hypothetical protein